METYGTDGTLSTALRNGKKRSPCVPADVKASLLIRFSSGSTSGTLSTDERKNDGTPGGGSCAQFITLDNVNNS